MYFAEKQVWVKRKGMELRKERKGWGRVKEWEQELRLYVNFFVLFVCLSFLKVESQAEKRER